MAFELIWENAGIYKKFHGEVTAEEFLASMARLQGDPRFDKARYSINDFSEVTNHSICEADAKKFAGYALGAFKTNPHIRIAVVTSDPVIEGLVCLYAAQGGGGYPLRLFTDLAVARAWVNT